MDAFLRTILSFPVVPLTVLLGVVLCYWLFVIAGLAGTDLEGAGHSVAGGAKVAGEALAQAGAAQGAAHASEHPHGGQGLLSLLGLGKIPITITASAVAFLAWIFCTVAAGFAGGSVLGQVAVLAGSMVLGLLCASVALRPLARVFATPMAQRRDDLIGRICAISSGKVEARFGSAALEDGGAGLLLHVFCARANTLKKGDRALIVAYDPQASAYEVEPLDWLLPEELEALEDPARAAAVLGNRPRAR